MKACALLVGMGISTTAMEISTQMPQNTGASTGSKCSDSGCGWRKESHGAVETGIDIDVLTVPLHNSQATESPYRPASG